MWSNHLITDWKKLKDKKEKVNLEPLCTIPIVVPLISGLGRQRQTDHCELKATPGYTRLNLFKRKTAHKKCNPNIWDYLPLVQH